MTNMAIIVTMINITNMGYQMWHNYANENRIAFPEQKAAVVAVVARA